MVHVVLGAGRVYREETVQTAQLGYIQKCICEGAVRTGKIRWRENVKGKKKLSSCVLWEVEKE